MENDPSTAGPWLYLAILKAREGEYEALATLRPSVRADITTLLVLRGGPKAKDDAGRLGEALDRQRTSMGREGPVILDGELLDEPTIFADCLAVARAKQWLAVPSTRLDRPASYQDVVREAARDGRGAVLRLGREDLMPGGEPLIDRLHALLGRVELAPENVDLVIDLREISWMHVGALNVTVRSTIQDLPWVGRWRHLAVAGSGMPATLREFPPDQISPVPRPEIALYDAIFARRRALPRLPTYADYGVAHPEPVDDLAEKSAPNMSASLRYSTEYELLIVKGYLVRSSGYERFPSLLAELVEHSDFAGASFSDGDARIKAAAEGAGPGNSTKWRSWATSHHLSLVRQQIASLYAP